MLPFCCCFACCCTCSSVCFALWWLCSHSDLPCLLLPRLQVRVFDFVVDKFKLFKPIPHPERATYSHSGTILFDHESETAVFDMVGVRFVCPL